MSQQDFKQLFVEDDASKFLEALPDAQRRPQYVTNSLPPSPPSFSPEEKEAALAIFIPKQES